MSMRMLRVVGLATLTSILAACGGGGGSGSAIGVLAPQPSPSVAHPAGTVALKFLIPAHTAAVHHLRTVAASASRVHPAYISASTATITIVVNGNTSGAITVPVSCTTFPCYTTATVSAPTNQTDTFRITAYDSNSQALSDGSVTQFIPLGLSTVNVSLGGVVVSVNSIYICPPSTPSCQNSVEIAPQGQSSWTVLVEGAEDADQNTIVGSYDAPIQLSLFEADLSQHELQLSKTQLVSSTDTAELVYTGQFDGEDAVAGTVTPSFCSSSGNPSTCTSSTYTTLSSYAVLEAPCPSGTIACSSYAAYASSPSLGSYGLGIAILNGTAYFNDFGTFIDSLTTAGEVTEAPLNGFLLVGQGATLQPPASFTESAGAFDPQAIGGTIYVSESSNVASFVPGTSLGSGSYAEYTSAQFSSGCCGGSAVGSDGSYYEGEAGSNGPEIARFNPASQSFSEFNFASTNAEQWLAALGSNIWFASISANGNQKNFIGYMPVTQNPLVAVPKANEFSVGAKSGTTTDYWQVNRIVAVPAGGSLPNGMIFFDASDAQSTQNVIGTFDPSAHTVTTFPLPASWPADASLGPIAYSSVDGHIYFSDSFNGIIGRIPAAAPSTAAIQGFGTAFNEKAGGLGTMTIDQSSGTLYVDSVIPNIPNPVSAPALQGITIVNMSSVAWSSAPAGGTPAFAHGPIRLRTPKHSTNSRIRLRF